MKNSLAAREANARKDKRGELLTIDKVHIDALNEIVELLTAPDGGRSMQALRASRAAENAGAQVAASEDPFAPAYLSALEEEKGAFEAAMHEVMPAGTAILDCITPDRENRKILKII